MDKNKRKELVSEYMNSKKEMGLYSFLCLPTNKSYVGTTQNMKATLNGSKFKLNSDNHSTENLQKDWKEYGEKNFEIKVLELLPYDESDLAKKDYYEELEVLLKTHTEFLEDFEIIKTIF